MHQHVTIQFKLAVLVYKCLHKTSYGVRADALYKSTFFTFTFFHHHGHAPDWSVAVSTSCFQRPLSWACHHAEFRPWLSGWRSASRVRSQVWSRRPGWHLQSLGSPRTDVCKALDRSRETQDSTVVSHRWADFEVHVMDMVADKDYRWWHDVSTIYRTMCRV